MAKQPPPSMGMLWSEPGEQRVGPVARVALLTPVPGSYSFAVPDELAAQVEPGRRVVVPFGRRARLMTAFCLSVAQEPWTSTLKPIREVLDEARLLNDSLLSLGQWISRYYACPLGRTLAAMVPEAVRSRSGFRSVCYFRTGPAAQAGQTRMSAKRRAVLELLARHPNGLPQETLAQNCKASPAVLNAMVKVGLIETWRVREPAAAPNFDQQDSEPTFTLNAAQNAAIERIVTLAQQDAFRAVLLFGVSGSGKTEVYVRAIRSVVDQGRQAILLVPEIALTTQIVERLARRFRDVAVIHSGLTGVQRSLTWAAIARSEKKVIIGTRSAVFAPCPKLGLMVIDEEQEGSYKNLQSPRFHVRDVAIKRAQLCSVPIVLGSATPALETWHNCHRLSHFERLDLPARVSDLPLPDVEFVDMRFAQAERRGIHLLSPQLEKAIAHTLSARQQVVLLLNRRGYASYLMCNRCRHPVVCPNCSINMVFHQTSQRVMCHYCQSRRPAPQRCADDTCGGLLVRWGMGTQRVEEEMSVKFSAARLARADSDTMRRAEDYTQLIERFTRRELDVLIGTQMIAKGLDFPAVALVGVINADTSLSQPDLRAAERTFQLVTQVAGRAGRAEAGGRVVVQSFAGLSPPLNFALRHDYAGFAEAELAIRQRGPWPPFSRLARLVVSHTSHAEAREAATRLADRIREHLREKSISGDVLGPQSAAIARVRNLYRYDFLLRTADAAHMMDLLNRLRADGVLKVNAGNLIIDVDPYTLS